FSGERIVTAAGVSSGIDMALALVERMFGRERAEIIQLAIEYDPQPPVDAGSPAKARPEVVTGVQQLFGALPARANRRPLRAGRADAAPVPVRAPPARVSPGRAPARAPLGPGGMVVTLPGLAVGELAPPASAPATAWLYVSSGASAEPMDDGF